MDAFTYALGTGPVNHISARRRHSSGHSLDNRSVSAPLPNVQPPAI